MFNPYCCPPPPFWGFLGIIVFNVLFGCLILFFGYFIFKYAAEALTIRKLLMDIMSVQIYDFDRDYKDVGVARFTTKSFVVRNCLPNVKSPMLLSAWNPPPEWGKYATCIFCLL